MDVEDIYVGMRVVSRTSFAGLQLRGKHGTIVEVRPRRGGGNWVGVEFDDMFPQGHTCNGLCAKGHGRWGSPSSLAPEESAPDPIPEDLAISFEALLC